MLPETLAAIHSKQILKAGLVPGRARTKFRPTPESTAGWDRALDVGGNVCEYADHLTVGGVKVHPGYEAVWVEGARCKHPEVRVGQYHVGSLVHLDDGLSYSVVPDTNVVVGGRVEPTHLRPWICKNVLAAPQPVLGHEPSPKQSSSRLIRDIISGINQGGVVELTAPIYDQYYVEPSRDIVDRVLGDLLALRDGWDGLGSLAPSRAAKEIVTQVIGQIAPYLDQAEIEVDPSVGDVSFHWYLDSNSRIVSVTVQQTGRVVVVSSSVEGDGTRLVLDPSKIDRVGRAAVDAGLGKLYDPV